MNIVCLDMEGVLVPEIWIAFSEASGIPELRRTTRDEPDYDKLMTWRLGILKEHGLGLKEIQDTTGRYVGCLEELGLYEGWITEDQVRTMGKELSMTRYGKYLLSLIG